MTVKINPGIKSNFNDMMKCREILKENHLETAVKSFELHLFNCDEIQGIKERKDCLFLWDNPAIHAPIRHRNGYLIGMGFNNVLHDLSIVFGLSDSLKKDNVVVTHLTTNFREERKQELEDSVELLGFLMDIMPKNSRLALENDYDTFNDVYKFNVKHVLLERISDFQYIFDRVSDKRLGICLDTAHAGIQENLSLHKKAQEEFSIASFVEQCGKNMIHVHLADYSGFDEKGEGLALGKGMLNYPMILPLLKKYAENDFSAVAEIKDDHLDFEGHKAYDYSLSAFRTIEHLI